jgi:hypothetical protein
MTQLKILAEGGYLENPQKVGNKLLIVNGNSYGFEVCAHTLGFPMYDKLLLSAMHAIMRNGIPMTGDELAHALSSFGALSRTIILYLLKAMRLRAWIRFIQPLGKDATPSITDITAQGRRAAESVRM